MAFLSSVHTSQNVNNVGVRRYGASIEEELYQLRWNRRHAARLSAARADGNGRQEADRVASSPVLNSQPHDYVEMEESWTGEGNYYENDEPPQQQSARMSMRERILHYATYVQRRGLSKDEIKDLELLVTIISGTSSSLLSYERDVKPFLDSSLEEYNTRRYYFCSTCEEAMDGPQSLCKNVNCNLYNMPIKRAKKMQRIEIHVMDMIPQLRDILICNVANIIEMHQSLHAQRAGERIAHDDEDRGDIRLYEGYYENIENSNEFARKELKVLLSLSTDGFRPRRLSKREVWPLYIRVEGLPQAEANDFYNSILSGVIYNRLKPSDVMVETLFLRLESELHDLHESPLRLQVGEELWNIKIALYRGIADMPAQQTLFGLPRWNAEYGCSKCYIKGVRMRNKRVWIKDNENDVILQRNPDSYFADAEHQQFGMTKTTPVMRITLPCHFSPDALHVCSEGITRNRLRDLVTPTSGFPGLKIGRQGVKDLQQSLMTVSWRTYSNRLVLSLEDLPTCTAAEVDELAFIIFPLVVAVGIVPCPVAATSLLGYWLCLKIISRSLDLTVTKIELARMVAKMTRELWIIKAPETYTMKCHWFFDHAMEDEISKYGTVYQWSACPFESHHKRLQLKFNQSTTNSTSLIVEKYLLTKKLKFMLEDNTTESLAALRRKLENSHENRLPLDIRINCDVYIPKNSRLSMEALREEHKNWVGTGDEPYTRLVVKGKVYASRSYWKRSKSSRQDLVCFEEEELENFGSIQLFIYKRANNTVRLLYDGYTTSEPFSSLHDTIYNLNLTDNNHATALRLMRAVIAHNSYFREITGTLVRRTRCISQIRGPCVHVKFGERSFISRF